MNNLINDIKQDLIDKLNDLYGVDDYACDLHNHLCNTDHFIIGAHKAKQWLGNHAFEVIEIVKEYEQDNFGEVSTDLSLPEKVANMYAYVVGEHLLDDSDWFHDCLSNDEHIREIDCQMIANDLAA
tara:strand:+ start:658 stop:1035 length:378 start_codon:yes stop_codon:yes gene_type:complete